MNANDIIIIIKSAVTLIALAIACRYLKKLFIN